MRNGLCRIARRVDPVLANIRASVASEMTYLPDGWQHTTGGWHDAGVVEAQERHWPTLVANLEGPGPLGVSHLPWSATREDRAHHNTMMSYGYVLARASRQRDGLSVLDWGGGAGHYYLYSRALLPDSRSTTTAASCPGSAAWAAVSCRTSSSMTPKTTTRSRAGRSISS